MPNNTDAQRVVHISFPVDLMVRIRAAAAAEHRSMSGQVRHLVEAGLLFRSEKRAAPAASLAAEDHE